MSRRLRAGTISGTDDLVTEYPEASFHRGALVPHEPSEGSTVVGRRLPSRPGACPETDLTKPYDRGRMSIEEPEAPGAFAQSARLVSSAR
jgi:hypothetical protein